jgi:predicted nucleic-acid-binding Zn-ribbon protein
MLFVRKTGFSNLTDPRQKKYAIYKCDVCQHEESYDVTNNPTFDYTSAKRCPNCKSLSNEEYIESLRKKIDNLTNEKNRITIQIEKLTSELESKVNPFKIYKQGEVYA